MSIHLLKRDLPPELVELADLALDLRRMGSQLAGRIWERLDAETCERTKNPSIMLLNARKPRLEAAAEDDE